MDIAMQSNGEDNSFANLSPLNPVHTIHNSPLSQQFCIKLISYTILSYT